MVYNSQLIKGILDGCIMKIISSEKTYGYEISEKLKLYGFENIAGGTLYPILLRLEKKEFIKGELTKSPLGPKRKYYELTQEGLEELNEFRKSWNGISEMVNNILNDNNL